MHPHFQCVGGRSLNWNEKQSFSLCLYCRFPHYVCIYCRSDSPNVNVLFLSAVECMSFSFEDLFIFCVFMVYMCIYSNKSQCTFIDET